MRVNLLLGLQWICLCFCRVDHVFLLSSKAIPFAGQQVSCVYSFSGANARFLTPLQIFHLTYSQSALCTRFSLGMKIRHRASNLSYRSEHYYLFTSLKMRPFFIFLCQWLIVTRRTKKCSSMRWQMVQLACESTFFRVSHGMVCVQRNSPSFHIEVIELNCHFSLVFWPEIFLV